MANFTPPFSTTGPRRNPTSDEKANGFACGPADQLLFNGLFHRIESELNEIITYAGLTPTDGQLNQVRQAIQAMIAAATGGGEPEDYLLINQAAARLPFYPEVISSDGRINLTSPAGGTVRIPAGVNFLHRGIALKTTVQSDFATVNSRTYHVRWSESGGYVMRNLSDNAYNPDARAETDPLFDSTFDDMLIARVVTNSSNVATITNLANKDRLFAQFAKASIESATGSAGGWSILPWLTGVVDWARTPKMLSPIAYNVESTNQEEAVVGMSSSRSRYQVTTQVRGYIISQTSTYPSYVSGSIALDVMA